MCGWRTQTGQVLPIARATGTRPHRHTAVTDRRSLLASQAEAQRVVSVAAGVGNDLGNVPFNRGIHAFVGSVIVTWPRLAVKRRLQSSLPHRFKLASKQIGVTSLRGKTIYIYIHETKPDPSVLKQDPNTQKVHKNADFKGTISAKHAHVLCCLTIICAFKLLCVRV